MTPKMTPHEFMKKAREVMDSHSEKSEFTLEIEKDCTSFWATLAQEMYFNKKLERMNMDSRIKWSMIHFANEDNLEVVNKQGRILKRFSKFFQKVEGEKLTDEILGIIGDRLQYHLNKESSVYSNKFTVDFTQTFDWNDGQFGHEGSCYWGCYSDSIPTLENAGAYCIRFYEDMDDENGIGRTWILVQNGALVCFNSYGVERPKVSKVIKKIFSESGITLHYTRREIQNSYSSEIPYINSGTGFLMTPEGINVNDIVAEGETYDINVKPVRSNREKCENCSEYFDSDEMEMINDGWYCCECMDELFAYCEKCEEYCDANDVHQIHGNSRYDYLCEYCAKRIGALPCEHCEEWHTDGTVTEEGDFYCEDCFYCEESEGESSSLPFEIERDFITGEMESLTLKWKGNDEILTMVYRDSRVDGLIIFQLDGEWRLTHELSGLSVTPGLNPVEPGKLFWAMERFAGLADWTKDSRELSGNYHLIQEIRTISREIGLI